MKKIFTMMVVFAASVASAFASVFTPAYNANGEATVPFECLKADGCISLEKGADGSIIVKNAGTGNGYFEIELPADGIDVSKSFKVTGSGDDIIWRLLIGSSVDNLAGLDCFYGSKFAFTFAESNRDGKTSHLNKMRWEANSGTKGTYTISSITLVKKPEEFKLAANEVNLTTSMFRDWTHWDNLIDNGAMVGCANAIGEELKAGNVIYGNGNVWGKTFADLTGYKALRIYASKDDQFRILMNRSVDGGTGTDPVEEVLITADASGVATLDISTDKKYHLNAIKVGWGTKVATVKAIALVYDDSPVFSETSYWNPISKATRKPNVTRNLVAGLNTICLPFNVEASDFGTVFGDATAKAYQFKGAEDKKLCFEEVTSIEAGVPYLLNVAQAHEMGNVGKVDILVEEPKSVTVDGVTFKGTFNVKVLGEKNLFLGKDGNLKVPASTEGNNNKLKGMRAFFVLPEATTAYSLSFGGETTGIQAIEGEKAEKAQGVYTISGVKVADNTANLAKGLYIVNGKKFIQK